MKRHTTSPPRQRQAMFVLSLAFAIAAAVFGGGSFKQSAAAAEGDGSLVICKQYWATAPNVNNFSVEFNFFIRIDPSDLPAPAAIVVTTLAVTEGAEACSVPIPVPAGSLIEVEEENPSDWIDVPTYPRWHVVAGGQAGPETSASNVARFDADDCVDEPCTLIFKNKRDETGEGEVPPPGDPFRGSLTVCKDFVDNGDAIEIGPTAFRFTWTDRTRDFEFPIGPFMREGERGCSGFSVIDVLPGDILTLTELATPDFGIAPGFPKVELEGPAGLAPRTGNRVFIDLTTCSEADLVAERVGIQLIEGEPTFECRVTFSNRALAEGEEVPCNECTEPEPDPVVEEPTPEPDPVVVEPEPSPAPDPVTVAPDPSPTPEPVVADPVTAVPTVVKTPEPTQVVPTPTEATPTGEPATSTPEPQETVAGEVTTNPQPTPVAPSTGSGSVQSDGGRLVIAFGLAALSFAFFLGGMNARSRR